MRKIITVSFFCMVVVFLAYMGNGCKDNSGPETGPNGTLLQYQGCKEWSVGSDAANITSRNEDCLEYLYDGRKLILKHVNAGFNCCPGTLFADISVNDRVISVLEREQQAGCYCLCLFDLDMEIDNLEPGEYTIRVVEPYIEDGDESLEFVVQLSAGVSGCYCLERNYYPWTD